MRRYGAKNATSGTRRTNSMSADRPSSFGSRECQIGLPTFGRNGRGLGQEGGPEKYNRHAHDNGFSCSNRKRIKSIPLVVITSTASSSTTTTLSTAFVLNKPSFQSSDNRTLVQRRDSAARGDEEGEPSSVPPPRPLLRSLPSSSSATTATCEMHPVRRPVCADNRKKISKVSALVHLLYQVTLSSTYRVFLDLILVPPSLPHAPQPSLIACQRHRYTRGRPCSLQRERSIYRVSGHLSSSTPSDSSDSHCALMNLEIIGASCCATGLPSRSSLALMTSFS
jgi:hypothetical protein